MKKYNVERARVYHPTREHIVISFIIPGGERFFQMSVAEAASLAQDLDAAKPMRPPFSVEEGAKVTGLPKLPSVLKLPLLSEPIRTVSMTDHPEGLGMELRMEVPEGMKEFKWVQIPMMADTARAIIGALQQRLDRMGLPSSPVSNPPSE